MCVLGSNVVEADLDPLGSGIVCLSRAESEAKINIGSDIKLGGGGGIILDLQHCHEGERKKNSGGVLPFTLFSVYSMLVHF